MDVHKNARLTPRSRAELVRRVVVEGQRPKAVATAFGLCLRTVRKWVVRWRAEGEAGLIDRSSRPHHLRRPTPTTVAAKVGELRRRRWTGKAIAAELGLSPATVSRILNCLGLGRLRDLEPAEPVRRYEREWPGELIHIDIKKLGRFEHGGHVIAIAPRFLADRHNIGPDFGQLILTPCMHTRKRLMFDYADAFVALPGGIGTIDELAEAMTWSKLDHHCKPIVIANFEELRSPWLALLDHLEGAGFLRAGTVGRCLVADKPDAVLPLLMGARQPVENARRAH